MNEIVKQSADIVNDSNQRLMLLKEVMTNPEVQPEKAVAMADLMFRIEDRAYKARFIEAKVAALAEMPEIRKDGHNTHQNTRYATWEAIQPIVRPILEKHGLVLDFIIGGDENVIKVAPRLSGHGYIEVGGEISLPPDIAQRGRTAVQSIGSSITYAKRYAAMAALNLVQKGLVEDNDGQSNHKFNIDQKLLDEGRLKALQGMDEYRTWFEELSKKDRMSLQASGEHDANKIAALKFDKGNEI